MANKVCIDGIWYELDEEKKEATVTRSNNKEEKYQGEVVIPEIVVYKGEKYSVVHIGYGAFSNYNALTSFLILGSVTSIRNSAFNSCSGITSISIPESVTTIGERAFSGCSGLTSIIIPKSVTSIGSNAFSGCSSLTSITISEGVTSIEEEVFGGCNNIASIFILKAMRKFGLLAFNGCSSLTSTTIPEGLTSIGEEAFHGCSNLTTITIPGSVTSIEKSTFYGCSSLTKITIPEGVTSIGEKAFYGCSSLTKIAISEGVTIIGEDAFSGCSGLTSITIPESVTSIGEKAFYGCSSLTSISIPEGVTSIGRWAFSGCSSLTSISIPESVTSIGHDAFDGCSAITSIVVAENNVTYDSRNNCNAIIKTNYNKLIAGCSTTIIPESVTTIGERAFSGCSGLTSIIIPESVTSIGLNPFLGCSAITSIVVAENNAIYDSRNNCNAIIKTNNNTLIAGCSTTVIPDNVTTIGMSAFHGCSGLTSINIPESVTNIGPRAFLGCDGLKEVYCYSFPKGLQNAFDKSLINNIVLHLPKYAIEENKDLSGFKEIIPIEAKVKKIELPETTILPEKSVHLLSPIITPRYANDQLKWSSSNEEVAVVNSKGRVITLSPGTATITAMATDGHEVCTSCKIVVRRMVKSIQLSQTSIKLVVGNSHMLNAIVTPKDAYDTSFIWNTTDDDIAMILGNGRIVAVSAGTATITAKANDGSEVTATCEVTVTE